MAESVQIKEITEKVNAREEFRLNYFFPRRVAAQIRQLTNQTDGGLWGACPTASHTDPGHLGAYFGSNYQLQFETKRVDGLYVCRFNLTTEFNSETERTAGGTFLVDQQRQAFYDGKARRQRVFIPLDNPMNGSLLVLEDLA